MHLETIFNFYGQHLPSIAIMMAFIEIKPYGLMCFIASDGWEPFSNTFSQGLSTRPVKIDPHEDDIFNRHSQLLFARMEQNV